MPEPSQLQDAIAAIKAGDRAKGRKLLSLFLQDNPTHENALLWLSATTNSPTEKRRYFERVLQINPNNQKAKRALAKLDDADESPDLEAMAGGAKPVPVTVVKPKGSGNQALIITALIVMACCIFLVLGSILTGGSRRAAAPSVPSGPTPTPGPAPTPIVYSFNGRGDDVVQFFVPKNGLAKFGLIHKGERNFIVELLRADGEYIDLLVNEAGEYEGERVATLEAGNYVLEITADGGWGAVILPPQ